MTGGLGNEPYGSTEKKYADRLGEKDTCSFLFRWSFFGFYDLF